MSRPMRTGSAWERPTNCLRQPALRGDWAAWQAAWVEIDRQQFNQLADEKSTVGSYRRAAETGHIRFEGDSNVAKLVIRVIEAHEQRAKLKKVH